MSESESESDRKAEGSWNVTPTINTPAAQEIEHYGKDIKVCGQCRHLDVSEAAHEDIRRQKFYLRLVREDKWKVQHLGSDPRTHGLCGASGGEMLTGIFHKACDRYSPRPQGLMSIRRTK